MRNNLILESYLSALDKALGAIPISQRVEIIMEIKSQVLAAQDKDPKVTIDQILVSLGQPEAVANRFLLERGLKTVTPSRTPILKWLVIGFLGTFAIFTLFVTFLVFKFSPLIEINDRDGHVKVFGGAIDVDGNMTFDEEMLGRGRKKGKFKIKVDAGDKSAGGIVGSRVLDPSKIDRIFIPFTNGQFEINYNTDNKLSWECKTASGSDSFSMASEQKRVFTLDFGKTKGIKCQLDLPSGIPVAITGVNGDLQIEEPAAALDIQLTNGRVVIDPSEEKVYKYDLKVTNGKTDQFDSIDAANAIMIKVEIKNGYVQKG